MQLVEETGMPEAVLPVDALRAHVKLGTGFGDDAVQEVLLAGYLRAAIAAIEGRVGKALIARRFRLVLSRWRDGRDGQALPVAPVVAVLAVIMINANGDSTELAAQRYGLRADAHRPRLVPRGVGLPAVPDGGRAEVVFDAGFGPSWTDVPADLQQAVLLLAAHYHEFRHEAGQDNSALPFGIMALIERWRTVRVLGGGAR